MTIHNLIGHFFQSLDVKPPFASGNHTAHSPITGETIASIEWHDMGDAQKIIDQAESDFPFWRDVPMPVRGRLIGIFGQALRDHKRDLAAIVTLEAGKITSESLGEVQEMIDIAEY